MKASYVTLILNSTGGYFDKADVPSLYVEIQNHRAELERSLSRQGGCVHDERTVLENY